MNNRSNLDKEFELPEVQRKADSLIRNSFNLKMTKDRMSNVAIFGVIAIGLFIYLGLFEKNAQALAALSIIYALVTLFKKIGYGFGVISYKKVIQKILYDDEYRNNYINELNLQEESNVGQ